MSERNGAIEASVGHLGSLKLTGRDVLLAGVLIALGAGAITVQWISLSAFQSALARDVLRVFQQADRADADREEILAVLRAKSCAEALAAPTRKEIKP